MNNWRPDDSYLIYRNKFPSDSTINPHKKEYEHGLEKFSEISSDYYFSVDKEQVLFITCSKKKDMNDYYPSCRVNSKYKSGLSISYTFDRNNLSQWKEIDTKIKHLFDSFEHIEKPITKETNGAK